MEYSDEYEEFYAAYPRHEGKKAAYKRWPAAVKKVKGDYWRIVLAAASYAVAMRDTERRYIKLPATWLNAEPWEDDSPKKAASTLVAPVAQPWKKCSYCGQTAKYCRCS
jgi:hypothetical protein